MGGYGYPGAKTSLIANRLNCGGNKKAGTPPRIGVPITILNTKIYQYSPPHCCPAPKKCVAPYLKPSSNPVQNRRAMFNM